MSRITKVILEQDNRILRDENNQLRYRNSQLKELNELLKERQFDVEGFCKMHAEAISAIAHVVGDLREVIKRLH